MKQKLALLVTAAGLTACSDVSNPTRPAFDPEAKFVSIAGAADIIPGRFIVTVRDGVSGAAVAAEHGLRPDFVYSRALNGFAGSISELAKSGLLRDARVLRIEPDGIARAVGDESPTPSWGLDRIDQTSGVNNHYAFTNTGLGVTAYIIDTGIQADHPDFAVGPDSRVLAGHDEVTLNGSAADCNGHGTHVAGTVGGNIYGVAKDVKLVPVRVLDCGGSGTWSGVIGGMDWVAQNHVDGPAVANMSLGGGANTSVDNAVRGMIADGVATAVAAGNGNWIGIAQDACRSSPARVAEAMTIGATDNTDRRASWSNYGNCVDWFAPGVSITSDWLGSGTKTISGTSMATPHTTGVAALYLQSNSTATPAEVRDALFANTTKHIVTNSRTTNNNLLFTNY